MLFRSIPVILGGCGTGRTWLTQRLRDRTGRSAAHYIDVERSATTPERFLQAVTTSSPFAWHGADKQPATARERLPSERGRSGATTLHALEPISRATRSSIVKIDLDGNRILGDSGIGKSESALELIARGHKFIAEFYADLDYRDDGSLIITMEHDAVDPAKAAAACLRAIKEGKVRGTGGKDVAVRADAICVHSDTPNAVAIANAVREAVKPYLDAA